jgi:hypothetical protein
MIEDESNERMSREEERQRERKKERGTDGVLSSEKKFGSGSHVLIDCTIIRTRD